MPGFFKQSTIASRPRPTTIPRCGACGLSKHCNSPKMEPYGDGKKGIFILAEAPGREEDKRGIPFVGNSGEYLKKLFRKYGVDLDRDCLRTNAVICRPKDNRNPTDTEIESCRPNVLKVIKQFNPKVILLFGGYAVKSLLSHTWQADKIGTIGKWVGWQIPDQALNAWICPTWHPAFVIRDETPKVYETWFERHLQWALEKSLEKAKAGRPWLQGMPDYADKIGIEVDPKRAATQIRDVVECCKYPVSFDYETNMLKPDADEARIVSASVCIGKMGTIAYPWVGEAITATGELLRSKVPKWIANAKFEDRWTRKEFGHRIRNVAWDTMQSAHVLDNRPGVTSVSFQAYVRLGQKPWDEHIKPYLKSRDGTGMNRIDEIDIRDLLLYNGYDAAVEYEIAKRQMAEMGVEL